MDGCWVEIKGEYPTLREQQKAVGLAQLTNQLVFLFYGNYEVFTTESEGDELCNFGILVVSGSRLIPVQTIWSLRRFLPVFFRTSYNRIVEAAVEGAIKYDGERNPDQFNWNLYDMDRATKDLMFALTGQRKFVDPTRVEVRPTNSQQQGSEE